MSSESSGSRRCWSSFLKKAACNLRTLFFLGAFPLPAPNSATNFFSARRRVERFGSDRQFRLRCDLDVSISSGDPSPAASVAISVRHANTRKASFHESF